MTDWIGRYVYDVVRRLPEGERQEVRRELTANIQDMLPEDAGEAAIKAVLNEMGDPAKLANQYRQRPNYLISPAIYDDYVRSVKLLVPLIGGILLAVGVLLGVFDVLKGEPVGHIVSNGLSMGISGTLQVLVWVTIGFIIADRTGAKKAEKAWQVESLPEAVQDTKSVIPLSDCIVELVVTVVFLPIALLVCSGRIPLVLTLSMMDAQVYSVIGEGFLAACVPIIAVCGILSLISVVIKTVYRRWSIPVCAAVLVSNVASVIGMMILLGRTDMFTAEFLAFLQTLDMGSFDLLRFVNGGAVNPVMLTIAAIVVIAAVIESASAIIKTVRATGLRAQ